MLSFDDVIMLHVVLTTSGSDIKYGLQIKIVPLLTPFDEHFDKLNFDIFIAQMCQ